MKKLALLPVFIFMLLFAAGCESNDTAKLVINTGINNSSRNFTVGSNSVEINTLTVMIADTNAATLESALYYKIISVADGNKLDQIVLDDALTGTDLFIHVMASGVVYIENESPLTDEVQLYSGYKLTTIENGALNEISLEMKELPWRSKVPLAETPSGLTMNFTLNLSSFWLNLYELVSLDKNTYIFKLDRVNINTGSTVSIKFLPINFESNFSEISITDTPGLGSYYYSLTLISTEGFVSNFNSSTFTIVTPQ